MDELDEEVLGFMNDLWKSLGVKDVFGKVAGVLYLEPEKISMEDLAEKTGYSLASISNATKLLTNIGMVKRIKKPGTRKVFFYMEKDILEINKRKIRFIQENTIKPMKKFMPQLIEKYQKKAQDERAKKKLAIIKNYHQQIIQFNSVLDNMLKELEELSAKNRENG